MSAATLALIIQAFQAAIVEAPNVIAVAKAGKNYITQLFQSGAISVAVQNSTHAHLDAVQAAVLARTVPPAWTVEADPA